jgi:glucan 1,3-beta-glucosidase
MSHSPPTGQGVAYDPIPNPQEPSDIHESLYDPPSEQAAPEPSLDDLNADEPSVNLVRPRFLGTIDGEGIRGSVASYESRAQSEGVSSLYALNPESLSARSSPRPGSERFSGRYRDDPRSQVDDTFDGPSVPLSTLSSQPRFLAEKQAAYGSYASKSRRNTIILAAIGGILLLIIAIILPVYFLVIKHTSNNAAASQQSHASGKTATAPSATSTSSSKALISGSDGSTVTMEDGSTFTYRNPFGGSWYYNPSDPFNNGAQAQSWTPPLNQTFNPGSDRIRGYVTLFWHSHVSTVNLRGVRSVNLGGWLVTEPVSFCHRGSRSETFLFFRSSYPPLSTKNIQPQSMSGLSALLWLMTRLVEVSANWKTITKLLSYVRTSSYLCQF